MPCATRANSSRRVRCCARSGSEYSTETTSAGLHGAHRRKLEPDPGTPASSSPSPAWVTDSKNPRSEREGSPPSLARRAHRGSLSSRPSRALVPTRPTRRSTASSRAAAPSALTVNGSVAPVGVDPITSRSRGTTPRRVRMRAGRVPPAGLEANRIRLPARAGRCLGSRRVAPADRPSPDTAGRSSRPTRPFGGRCRRPPPSYRNTAQSASRSPFVRTGAAVRHGSGANTDWKRSGFDQGR